MNRSQRHLIDFTLLVSLLLSAGFASPAAGSYTMPSEHPRIFFTAETFPVIADRCKVGGTHRQFYEELLGFADRRIYFDKTDGLSLPSYALVYRIHKYWNDTGYEGGGFEETKYWSYTRDALLASGSWGIDCTGASYAFAAEWIFDRLSPSDLAALAPKYGTPRTHIVDTQTWRDSATFNTLTSLIRSLLFAGTSVDGGDYSTEYQEVCEYIEDVFGEALDVQGGVGSMGPGYETSFQHQRAWLLEAFSLATGIDGWDLAGRWSSEWGKWLAYSTVPHRGTMEHNQDITSPVGGDGYKNTGLMAYRAQDPFHQAQNNRLWQEILARDSGDYLNAGVWGYVLWYDTDLPEYDPATAAPVVRLSEDGMERVYMTTGLGDPDATWASFEVGRYFYGHQHQTAGAFTIHRKGDLAIDSGYYAMYWASSGWDHGANYYHRSIAHNTVSIYDPTEPFYWGAGEHPLVIDGGQVVPTSAPALVDVLNEPSFHPSTMLRYENTDGYTYSQADLFNAYNQEEVLENRHLPFHPNKLTAINREFVFLKPNYFVVIDRVSSVDPDFVKVWNLHVTDDPVIEGSGVQRMGDAEAGIWDYAGASTAKITDGNDSYPHGSMFLKALLPQDRVMRKIGGRNNSVDGFAYWVGGFDGSGRYDPTEGANHHWGTWNEGQEYREDKLATMTIGWGRIEVEATTPALDDIFLNVLYPCDNTTTQMPETRLIQTENAVGAEIVNDRVILFGRDELIGIDSLSYSVDPMDTSAVHMVCNLIPSTTYRIFRDGTRVFIRRQALPAPEGAEEIVTPPPASTSQGILSFQFSGGGQYVIITDVAAVYSGNGSFAVSITWETDIPSTSRVEYGTTPSYGSWSALDPTLATSHSVTLTAPAVENDRTTYFRVHSEGAGDEVGASDGGSFQFDVIPPGPVTDLRVVQ